MERPPSAAARYCAALEPEVKGFLFTLSALGGHRKGGSKAMPSTAVSAAFSTYMRAPALGAP